MKALIAVSISREWVESEFLQQMGTWSVPSKWQVRFGWFKQFTAQERHNIAANEARYNYDKLLFMDTDQVYPPDYIERMLEHEEPVVTALNVSRYNPFEFTIYDFTGEETKYGNITLPTFNSVTPPDDRKVFECDMTGTGAMMLDQSVFEKLESPFFKDIFDADGCSRLMPDDFYFCYNLHKAGIKVTVDQSIIVKHIAKITASPYNTVDLKRAWEKVNSGYGYWKDGKR